MCKCKPTVYMIVGGVLAGVQLIGYTLWLGLRVGIGNLSDEGELSLLSILFVNMIACCSVYTYLAISQTDKAVRQNWLAYVITTSADSVMLILWIIFYEDRYNLSSAGFYLYVLYGTGVLAKVLVNGVVQRQMRKYLKDKEDAKRFEEEINFEDFHSKSALTLVVME